MMLLTYFLIPLFALLNLNPPETQNIYLLKGKIDQKYPFTMKVSVDNMNNAKGYYYYDKYKKPIMLKGKMKDGFLMVYESDNMGIYAKISDSDEVEGYWFDNAKDQQLNFDAKLKSDKKVPINLSALSLEGKYDNLYNSEDYIGSTKIEYVLDHYYKFSILNTTRSGCIADIEGIIEVKDNKATFSKYRCEELSFTFDGNRLNISEKGCFDHHGSVCFLGGEYERK